MFDIIEVFIVFLGGIVIGWCSFFFGIIPTDEEMEGERMKDRDEIKSIIVKSLETAQNYEIADGYAHIVSCGDCPYWHDCRNEYVCDEYILDKLDAEKEGE